jgi:hypothetical protein
MAVVWRNWQHGPAPTVAEPLLGATATAPASAGGTGVDRGAPPAHPAELSELGAVMDRAELLRLVRAS